MKLISLENKSFNNESLQKYYTNTKKLIDAIAKRNLDTETILLLNKEIEFINNSLLENEKKIKTILYKKKNNLLKILEKRHKLVPKNYYRNLWLVLGITAFGVPFGLMFGFALNNLAFLGLGLPIGMVIGIALGSSKDQEALKKGLQLDIEYF